MMLTAIGRQPADVGCDWTTGHEQLTGAATAEREGENRFLDAKRRWEIVCLGLVMCLLHDLWKVYPPNKYYVQ